MIVTNQYKMWVIQNISNLVTEELLDDRTALALDMIRKYLDSQEPVQSIDNTIETVRKKGRPKKSK